MLEALGWVGSQGLDPAHQEDLVNRILGSLDRARSSGRDPMGPDSCPKLQSLARRAPDDAIHAFEIGVSIVQIDIPINRPKSLSHEAYKRDICLGKPF